MRISDWSSDVCSSDLTCVCANRIYAQAGIHDAFVEKLTAATNKLQVAPGNEKGAEIGPLIDDKAVAKVREHIADAVSHGARVVTGGASHALGGRFFTPTLIRSEEHTSELQSLMR